MAYIGVQNLGNSPQGNMYYPLNTLSFNKVTTSDYQIFEKFPKQEVFLYQSELFSQRPSLEILDSGGLLRGRICSEDLLRGSMNKEGGWRESKGKCAL